MRHATHRAHHNRQLWRRSVASALGRIQTAIRGLADRVEPWHEDDEWYTAPPPDRITIRHAIRVKDITSS